MQSKFFKKDEVLEALSEIGYFIHTDTTEDARDEAEGLCKALMDHFGKEISVVNKEVLPASNIAVIYRDDKFPNMELTEDTNVEALIMEIENYRE